jgi:hypothetical protein
MKYEYFIAGRWRNKEEVLKVRDLLKDVGISYYCFLESSHNNESVNFTEGADPNEVMDHYEQIPNWREDPMVKKIFDQDMDALRASKNFVLVLPAGKSGHIEAGASYGMNKPTYAIGEQKETESLYLIFDDIFATLDDFRRHLEASDG